MILELKVKNFRSIRDWQSFSMLAEAKVKELDNAVIKHSGFNVLSTAIVYGRNASGKSNLLRAFDAMQLMVYKSANFKVDEEIPHYEPYKLDENYASKPVEFSIDFIAKNNIRYVYAFGFTKHEIIYENLKFYPKSQPATLYDRKKGEKIKYGEYLTGKKRDIENLLYKNQLFLSKIGTQKMEQLIHPFTFFFDYLFISTLHDTTYDKAIIQLVINEMVNDNIPYFKENINNLMKAADTGIDTFTIKEEAIHKAKLPEEMSDEEKDKIIEKYKYTVKTVHKQFEGDRETGNISFPLSDESAGTIKLFGVSGLILTALAYGQVLVIDELDKSLHPKLTRALIKIFQNPKLNPNKAQLIFATHDVSLLDNELFRRDQVWFAEKEYEGYSHYYAISDISGIRANVPYEKWYMSGRFGGMPVIHDDALEFQF